MLDLRFRGLRFRVRGLRYTQVNCERLGSRPSADLRIAAEHTALSKADF